MRDVGESLRLIFNTVLDDKKNLTIFGNLVHVCSTRSRGGTFDDGRHCGMIIKDNIRYNHINNFPKLATLDGTLSITNYQRLYTINGFGELTGLVSKVPREGQAENLLGGLTITFNEDLTSIKGFQKADNCGWCTCNFPEFSTQSHQLEKFGECDWHYKNQILW